MLLRLWTILEDLEVTKPKYDDKIEQVPWVKRVKEDKQCDGYRWSQMPVKAVWNKDGTRADPALKEKYRCKNKAKWHFTALKRDEFSAKSGDYCHSHLFAAGFYGSMDEDARLNRWVKRNRPEWMVSADSETTASGR
jgi:hypothetical protein